MAMANHAPMGTLTSVRSHRDCGSPRVTERPSHPSRRWGHQCLFAVLALLFFVVNASPATADSEVTEPKAPVVRGEPEPGAHPKPKPPAPLGEGAVEAAIQRGVAFLVGYQNQDGSWGSAKRTKDLNIYAPVPGAHDAFRTGTTALALAALLEAGEASDAKTQAAIDKGESWLVENLPTLRRATPDAIYNVWGHAYAIQALVRMLPRKPDDAARTKRLGDLIRSQFDRLERYESVDGGWGYYDFRTHTQRPGTDSISFTTATVLIAFYEAREAGFPPPEKPTERALAAIRRQRKSDFSYLYGEYLKWKPMHPVNRPGGSLGRSQVCNLALRLFGDAHITDEILGIWLDRLIARNLWLDIGRKRPVPHESWFAVAGYFYYYGHYYGAMCVEKLPVAERAFYQDHLALLLLPKQEKDGSWWDYPLYDYHHSYGTAFAVMTLHRCRRPKSESKPGMMPD